ASPYSKKVKKAWRESTADRLGPELVPYFGMLYLAIGLPVTLVMLWLWADSYGLVDPTVAPDPSIKNLVREIFRVPLDPFSLALFFALCCVLTAGGLGTMLRHEWGRKGILLFHALLSFRE